MPRIAWVSLVAVCLLATGCGGGGDDEAAPPRVGLTPTFPSEIATTTTAKGEGTPSSVPGADAARPSTSGPSPAAPPAPGPGADAAPTTASFTDPTGDLTVSVDRPPRYADLAGATLTRSAAGFELRVRLGETAPSTGPRDRTMNIASFYDVSGDGTIDYEVWLNLAAGGWGGAYFDATRRGGNRFGDQAGVAIEVVGDEVVARFPLSHLASAEQFRWSTASEWGRYEVIGTAAAARDDAPDNDVPAHFPTS